MPDANMAGFTHVFRADIVVSRPRRVTKRARQHVSCQLCRRRKLRCDREQPVCGSCLKRGDGDSCTYAPNVASDGIAGADSAVNAPSTRPRRDYRPRQEVQTRLQQLEQLVSGLLSRSHATGAQVTISPPESSSSPNGPPTATAGAEASPSARPAASSAATGGHISRNGIEMPFVGATHWTAVLESIHDIRDYIEEGEGEAGDGPGARGLRTAEKFDPIFGVTEPITIRAVMAALPSRTEVDKLLGMYDNGHFTLVPVLHAHQFRRQYASFWLSPASTSFLWISILFSTLALTIPEDIPEVAEEAALAQQRFYATKAMQCLVAGEYFKAKPLAVEALVMYILTHVSSKRDSDPYIWTFFSVAVRLAQRMGYHRDPTQISSNRITPFQAEMRRRTWFLLEAFDLMYSMQLGMPTVIQDDQCDTAAPTNLHDEDFDEDCVALPPARPDAELTKALYIAYKSKLIRQSRRIVLHALSVRPHEYEETLALHADLESIHDNIPPPLRTPTIHGTLAEADTAKIKLTFHCIALELMYLKALCLLHRPYLTRRKHDSTYELSRQSCRRAALEILDMHSHIEVELRPSGKLFERRYLLGTLTLHDFLIAAMVLCLDLNETTGLSPRDREAELLALRVAYGNWSSRASTSRDAAHAKKVLGAMLRKVSKARAAAPETQREAAPPSPAPTGQEGRARRETRKRPLPNREMLWINRDFVSDPKPPAAAPAPATVPDPFRQEKSTPGYENRGLLSTIRYLDFSDVNASGPPDSAAPDDLGSLIDNANEIDWNMVDSYLLDRDSGLDTVNNDPVQGVELVLDPPPMGGCRNPRICGQPW